MKIQLLSDLHFEFWLRHRVKAPPILRIHEDTEVLVLAGDIIAGSNDDFCRVYEWISMTVAASPRATKPSVILIAGNHEHYGRRDIGESYEAQRQFAREYGFHFLENDSVAINDVRFFGCTLWTDYILNGKGHSRVVMEHADRIMSDARMIKTAYSRFEAKDAASLYEQSKRGIAAFLSRPVEAKKVVITHHGISLQSIHSKYDGDPLNGAFSSTLLESFQASGVPLPNLCPHGHTHETIAYNFDGKCRVYANPAGYPSFTKGGEYQLENASFNDQLLIDV